jgi:protease IV
MLLRLCLVMMLALSPIASAEEAPDMLEVVEIAGEIHMGTATFIKEQVAQINQNKKIKAVLLVVDSPGGSVLPTSAIYDELAKLKVPVVAWCPYICASGGAYVMMAPSVKYIGIRSDAMTGSVGVIMQITNYKRLLEWAKVDVDTYKSGILKDSGNSSRTQSDEDRKYLQSIIDTLAGKFYDVVGKARKITNWEQVKSARIFIGQEAVQVGLVDGILSRDQAIAKAKSLSGAKSIYTREELKKMSRLAEGNAEYKSPQAGTLQESLSFALSLAKEIRQGEAITFAYRSQIAL